MPVPVRKPQPAKQRKAFSLRQTVLCFGLVATVACGVGLTLKLIVRAADEHPMVVVAAAATVVAATAGLWSTRRRRTGRRFASAAVGAAYQVIETHTVEEERNHAVTRVKAETPDEAFASDEFAAMDPVSFEQAVAALCERDGCQDVHVVGGAGDLGADVVATTPDGRRVVIQCKRYGPLNKVGSQDVQRFGGTCFAVHEAHVAAVVTTGEFTQPAADYAEQCGIRCINHRDLVAWTDGTGPTPWEAESAGSLLGRAAINLANTAGTVGSKIRTSNDVVTGLRASGR
ncbi:restriction endonuclease [Streptomyces sp. ISL-96]|uniref:restriction endonuclease n=1 Tax=Streptomyces sp. ISL-96 TaxID=2819191 RepID=UPI001BE7B635|nr:restriction endonuclease [Streptomyces sp. ISL-96]MBT2492749.1 restriction endonuclease [Streptomyces sp. ISL-96]